MKKKLALLVVAAMLLTAIPGLFGSEPAKAEAAPQLIKIDYYDGSVTAHFLNMRSGPSTKYHIITVLKNGQKVKLFGKVDNWYMVYDPASGHVGAVNSKYIKVLWPGDNKAPSQEQKPKPQQPQPPKLNLDDISKDEQTLLNLVNQARTDAGVGALSFDAELMRVARIKARDMVDNGYFSHNSPTYGSPFDMMKAFRINFNTAGENIAGNSTVEGAFKAWMGSEGHKRNILNPKFNLTGIGIVDSPTYGKILVQQFIGR